MPACKHPAGIGTLTCRVLARLPRDFTDIFTDESAADAAAIRAQLSRHQRGLQAGLILGRPQEVADRLVDWVLQVRFLPLRSMALIMKAAKPHPAAAPGGCESPGCLDAAGENPGNCMRLHCSLQSFASLPAVEHLFCPAAAQGRRRAAAGVRARRAAIRGAFRAGAARDGCRGRALLGGRPV